MRIGAIDIGSNSTRLLVADVNGRQIDELFRRSVVTRLGDRVDQTGKLSDEACERVFVVIEQYARECAEAGVEKIGGVATSAVRDSVNGADFCAAIAARYGTEIAMIDGESEAQLTFAGAGNGGALGSGGRTVVADIGGGSTELIVGEAGELLFHRSTDIGAVRQSERHLHSDPPNAAELGALLDEVGGIIDAAVPSGFRESVDRGIGVAGTPTVLASIDQRLEVFDPWKVHGYAITRPACERLLDELAALPLEQRRHVTGLHPDRAPTIVAGAAIMLATMRAFDLPAIEVSEHDILYGLALQLAR
jgi:exopolyphosphatase/guanosine-5'-triphosphate,3'-diphosphate pyrophosphatase